MAKRYNMRLVLKQRFSEFFQEKVQKDQHRSLMMKMMALEVKGGVRGGPGCCSMVDRGESVTPYCLCCSRSLVRMGHGKRVTHQTSTTMLKSTVAEAEPDCHWWV